MDFVEIVERVLTASKSTICISTNSTNSTNRFERGVIFQNRFKVASKRVQSDARIGFSEREQARHKIVSIRAEKRPNSMPEIWPATKIVVPSQCES